MRYLIYCDESDDKGEFYSNFYGGALLKLADQDAIEQRLSAAKGKFVTVEFKWTNITPYAEDQYIEFVRELFAIVREGLVKLRVMFKQNIHQTHGIEYDEENKFFILYYQFLKHAFGLQHCNVDFPGQSFVHVALDDVPVTKEQFANFSAYLSSLSDYPILFNARVCIPRNEIRGVNSRQHVILQAVDVVLGAIQFRLNNTHRAKPVGSNRRAKRTRAKHRVHTEIRTLIQGIYPNFNIGISTGEKTRTDRWDHPYAHWRFVPTGSVMDLSRGKRRNGAR